MKKIFLFIISVALYSCSSENKKPENENGMAQADTSKPRPNTYAKSSIEIKIFSNDSTADSFLHGFGYNVMIDGKLYVHQPNVPAVAGNNGFKFSESAKKAGDLVAYKIKNNIMPPSMTVHELDSVDALK
jgi:hypothetical protein